MKVLWITYDLPYPLNSGGKLRAYHLIKNLSKKFEITLFSYYRDERQLDNLPQLREFIERIEVFPRRPVWNIGNLYCAAVSLSSLLLVSYQSKELVECLKGSLDRKEFDLVQLEFLGVAGVLPMLKKAGVPAVLGNENVEYHIYRKYVDGIKNPFLRCLMEYDVWKMKRIEERFWRLADINLAVSNGDLEIMRRAGVDNVYLVPNGVDVDYYANYRKVIGNYCSNRALFTGNLRYAQNGEAVKWFMTMVLPLVKRQIPEFRLVIVSEYQPSWLNRFSDSVDLRTDSSSEFVNFVNEADVYVLPVWVKSGTNIKLLQAMATGFPIVSTSSGVSGYNLTHGREVLIADLPEAFAESVVKILQDSQLRQDLSSEALKRVPDYDWSNSVRVLEKVYGQIQLI